MCGRAAFCLAPNERELSNLLQDVICNFCFSDFKWEKWINVLIRDAEAEAEAEAGGSGSLSMEAEAEAEAQFWNQVEAEAEAKTFFEA